MKTINVKIMVSPTKLAVLKLCAGCF